MLLLLAFNPQHCVPGHFDHLYQSICFALAIAMFRRLRNSINIKMAKKTQWASVNSQKRATQLAFYYGRISGLVALPCTTAPLTSNPYGFIAQSGDLYTGFFTLYTALSIGMGHPLILCPVMTAADNSLSGAMDECGESSFGFMMLSWLLILWTFYYAELDIYFDRTKVYSV